MLPEPGALFDRYRIEALLGEGGMGRVYRAYDERLQRRVALKILHVPQGQAAWDSHATDGAARLLREARLAAALDHPNAVAIFDVGEARSEGEAAPLPYIAMELIVGRSIRAYVGVQEISVAERLRWLADVARALGAAHRRNLIHRDMKPENVMVRDDGVVKVLDFGIARRSTGSVDPGGTTQALGSAGTLTAEGVVVGTPFYMAPEQMRGESLDGRADQFSWAVMAYELLSGELPWDKSGDGLKVVSQVLTMDPPPLRTRSAQIPPAAEAIVSRALSKMASARFASMDEVVASLDALGMRPTLPPTAVAAIEVLGSAATIQSTRTSLATGGASAAPSVAAPPKPRRRAAWALGIAAVAVLGVGAAASVRLHTRGAASADAAALAPTTLVDLTPPKTNAEALAAYSEGMRALRRGEIRDVVRAFKHALELDPNLGPVLLRLGYGLLLHNPTQAREYFRRATELRATLTERDQGLLEAYRPFVETSPPDLATTRSRLFALAAKYPMDAELAYELGSADRRLSHYDDALPEYNRALRLDPGFANAVMMKAACLLALGEMDAAMAASKDCELANPGALGCIEPRLDVENEEGRCADLESDARKIILGHPDATDGYLAAGQALYALGSPLSAVSESIAQARTRMGERKTWLRRRQLLESNLEVLQGNFAEAEKMELAREGDPAIAGSSDEGMHALGDWARIDLALESGFLSKAADIAADHRARSQAWSTEVRVSDEPQFQYSSMFLAVLARAKRISPTQQDEARAALIAATDTKSEPLAGAYLWYAAYARPASTPDEARAALDVLPRYLPLPHIWYFPAYYAIGEVDRLAGRVDDAIPLLKKAASSCDAIYYPYENTRAHFALGEALEAKADTAGACAAYAVVMHRWGHAKPRSITADAARARMSSLRCEQ